MEIREIFPQAHIYSTFYRSAIGKTLIQINLHPEPSYVPERYSEEVENDRRSRAFNCIFNIVRTHSVSELAFAGR